MVLLCQTYIEKVGKALLLPVLSVMNILKEKKRGGVKLPLVVVMKKMNTREEGNEVPSDGYYEENNQKIKVGTLFPLTVVVKNVKKIDKRKSSPWWLL